MELTDEHRIALARFLGKEWDDAVGRKVAMMYRDSFISDADLMLALLNEAARRECLPQVREWHAGLWICSLRLGVATQTGEANSAPMAVVLACLQLKELSL